MLRPYVLTIRVAVFFTLSRDFCIGAFNAFRLIPRHGEGFRKGGVCKMAFDHYITAASQSQAISTLGPSTDRVVCLTDYMTLPVQQYALIEMPFQAKLDRVADLVFELTVPPVRFPGILTVQPLVTCDIKSDPGKVTISSQKCYLSGSRLIEKTGLNDRFNFRVQTTFTWVEIPQEIIMSKSTVKAAVDPPFVFRAIPKAVLEGLGNSAMKAALKQIESEFIRALMRDYERWADDEDYRMARSETVDPKDTFKATN